MATSEPKDVRDHPGALTRRRRDDGEIGVIRLRNIGMEASLAAWKATGLSEQTLGISAGAIGRIHDINFESIPRAGQRLQVPSTDGTGPD
jgi:hypothetical protein